jgi:hypothetical protein
MNLSQFDIVLETWYLELGDWNWHYNSIFTRLFFCFLNGKDTYIPT